MKSNPRIFRRLGGFISGGLHPSGPFKGVDDQRDCDHDGQSNDEERLIEGQATHFDLGGRNEDGGIIINSYSTADVSSDGFFSAGGLIGEDEENFGVGIANSFATGDVTGSQLVFGLGGLVGVHNQSVITNSYWHDHAGNPNVCTGTGIPESCAPVNDVTDFFDKTHPAYTSGSPAWDFTTPIWFEHADDFPKFVPPATEDTTPPRCEVIGVNIAHAAPPTNLLVEVEDTESGLDAINGLIGKNAVVNIPAFAVGTNAVVQVVADKIDESQRSRVEIQAIDVEGNSSTCDPVLVSLSSKSSGRMRETITDLPYAERFVTLYTSDPGFSFVLVNVNGRWFTLLGEANEASTIDIGSAMVAGVDNTITMRVWGAGTVMVSDVVPSRASRSRASLRGQQWSTLSAWNNSRYVY